MAFNLASTNYLDPRSGMPGNKPMQFLVGGTMGGNSQGFLGSTQPATTSATTTPKLDLLKVEKSPELNQTLKNLTADLDKLRTEQNTAADAFAKLNSELFNPDFLGRERAKFDLVPITNQLAANTNQYRTAVNEGLGLALDRANRNADLSRLGQTAGGGGLGDSSYNRLLQGQMFREAATPFLGAVADRERADAMWLEQLKQAQVGRDLALTQAYLNQQAMPAQLRAQLAAQQAGLLGNYANLFNNLNFLGVGGQNPMSSPFIGASPNVPYFPAPSPARRGTGAVTEADNWIPEWLKKQAPGVTIPRSQTPPTRYTPDQLYQDSQGVWRVLPEYGGDQSWYDYTALGGTSAPYLGGSGYRPVDTAYSPEYFDWLERGSPSAPEPIDYATEFE